MTLSKTSFSRRKEELLARTPMIDLADALGLQPAGKKDRYCPAHNDQQGTGHRPNLHLYDREAHCFACGFHADAFALVAKVKGVDFRGAFDFLAARLGLPGIGEPSPRGLGNKARVRKAKTYPNPPAAPLPSTPSPTLAGRAQGEPLPAAQGLGYDAQGNGATVYPNPPIKAPLPADAARSFASFAEAEAYWRDHLTRFDASLRKDTATGAFVVAAPTPAADVQGFDMTLVTRHDVTTKERRPSLRVQVFEALLALGSPAAKTAAGVWLAREKGIEPGTQDRFGLIYLDDPRAAAGELVKAFGIEALVALGVYHVGMDKAPHFSFARHRLIFPFFWKGKPVDAQGRDVTATGKQSRFCNTASKNALPYNADALLDARATGEPVFLCEGATDTLTLAQSGRLAVGIVGTGGFKPAWLPSFAGLDVYLAFDADEAGQKATATVAKLFVDAGHTAPRIIKLPNGFKDINHYFRKER